MRPPQSNALPTRVLVMLPVLAQMPPAQLQQLKRPGRADPAQPAQLQVALGLLHRVSRVVGGDGADWGAGFGGGHHRHFSALIALRESLALETEQFMNMNCRRIINSK